VARLGAADARRTLDVPGAFPTIQVAIDAAQAGDTIHVGKGTYSEALLISKDGIILEGAGPDDTVLKGSMTTPAIRVLNSRGAEVRNLTIREGSYGIWTEFSCMTCSGIRVKDNGFGLAVRFNSYARVMGSTFTGNKKNGILVLANSSTYVTDCAVTANGEDGIQLTQTCSGILNNNAIADNGGNGVQVMGGSSLTAIGNQVLRNHYSGFGVTGHSTALLNGGNQITQNGDFSGWRAGVGIHHNSEVTIGYSDKKDVIADSNGPGLFVANSSSLFLKSGIVSGNHGDGIHLRFDSVAQLEEGASVVLNHGYGINTGDEYNDSKYWSTGCDLGSEGPPDTRNDGGPTNVWSF
jgi:nitrous oxidase accessory protein NosD